jgi:hypothetical protein
VACAASVHDDIPRPEAWRSLLKASRIVVLVSTVLALGACGTAPSGPHDATGGLVVVSPRPPPDWLPGGMSIQFIQDQVAEGAPSRVLTGFRAGLGLAAKAVERRRT